MSHSHQNSCYHEGELKALGSKRTTLYLSSLGFLTIGRPKIPPIIILILANDIQKRCDHCHHMCTGGLVVKPSTKSTGNFLCSPVNRSFYKVHHQHLDFSGDLVLPHRISLQQNAVSPLWSIDHQILPWFFIRKIGEFLITGSTD